MTVTKKDERQLKSTQEELLLLLQFCPFQLVVSNADSVLKDNTEGTLVVKTDMLIESHFGSF